MSDHNPNALKHMYGPAFMKRMAESLSSSYSKFDSEKFLKLTPELLKLEMKPRVILIRNELKVQLPSSFPEALNILMKSVKTKKLSGFDLWPYTEFIQTYGLQYEKISLNALKTLTILFTSEFAVRPFLRQDPSETLKYLFQCAKDDDYRVRRWASEGSRPRLPWGEKLHHFIKHPELTMPILDELCFDPELFVRKSVANHLNDIAKDHPVIVIKTLKRWKKDATGENKARWEWITRHSMRTLIKNGHPEALELLGVKTNAKIKLSRFSLQKNEYKINDRMLFSFILNSNEKQTRKIVVDYKIHFLKAHGKNSAKVFKLKTFEISPGEKVLIKKDHHLKAVTTRVHYPGAHFLEIMINGVSYKKIKWNLER